MKRARDSDDDDDVPIAKWTRSRAKMEAPTIKAGAPKASVKKPATKKRAVPASKRPRMHYD